MKMLALMLMTSGFAFAAQASNNYVCDNLEINSLEMSEGNVFSVRTLKIGEARVYSKAVYPNSIPELTYELDALTKSGRVFSSSKLQDLIVSFVLSEDRSAGVLKIQSTVQIFNNATEAGQQFICTKR